MLDVSISNKLRHARLEETVNKIVAALENGDEVRVFNEQEHVVSTVEAIEKIKQRLDEDGFHVTQKNDLQYDPVYTSDIPETATETATVTDTETGLEKKKIHHYRVIFSSIMRATRQ